MLSDARSSSLPVPGTEVEALGSVWAALAGGNGGRAPVRADKLETGNIRTLGCWRRGRRGRRGRC